MTRLKASDAETGIWNTEGWSRLLAGNEVVRDNTVTPHSGSWSWCTGGDGIGKSSWQTISPAVVWPNFLIMRQYLRIGSVPASSIVLWPAGPGLGASNYVQLRLNTSGALGPPLVSDIVDARTSPPLTPGQWYKLEYAAHNYQADGKVFAGIVRLENVEFNRIGGISGSPNTINRAAQADASAAVTTRTNIDDLVINDSQGSVNNYWADDVKPLSRSALGYVQPTVRATGTPAFSTATITLTHAANAPASVTDDLLVAAIWQVSSVATITPPSGWTLLGGENVPGNNGRLSFFMKRATASEPSTYTFTTSSNAGLWGSVIWSLAGVHLTTPIIDGWFMNQTTNSPTACSPPLDLTEGDTLILTLTAFKHATLGVTTPQVQPTTGLVNIKDATSQVGFVGGFYGRADGGLVPGDSPLMSGNNLNIIKNASIAFRAAEAPIVIPPPSSNKFLAVA